MVTPQQIVEELKKTIVGKDEILKKVTLAIIAKGHVLIDDIPGVGKTTMAMSFAKVMGCDCNRIQFTPDVMPSDIMGFSAYNPKSQDFEYKPGAAMCNLLLADEINRTSSKTHSALLEVMEERKVSVDSVTRNLPRPFTVIATQNPTGSVGTQLLPESQLDRFMIRLSMGYPTREEEVAILKKRARGESVDLVNTIACANDILMLQKEVENIFVHDAMYDYIVRLVQATRKNEYIELGISPRGAIALTSITKAEALYSGREYCVPNDVKEIFADVACHRIVLNTKAKLNKISEEKVINDILSTVQVPRLKKG